MIKFVKKIVNAPLNVYSTFIKYTKKTISNIKENFKLSKNKSTNLSKNGFFKTIYNYIKSNAKLIWDNIKYHKKYFTYLIKHKNLLTLLTKGKSIAKLLINIAKAGGIFLAGSVTFGIGSVIAFISSWLTMTMFDLGIKIAFNSLSWHDIIKSIISNIPVIDIIFALSDLLNMNITDDIANKIAQSLNIPNEMLHKNLLIDNDNKINIEKKDINKIKSIKIINSKYDLKQSILDIFNEMEYDKPYTLFNVFDKNLSSFNQILNNRNEFLLSLLI